MARIAPLDPPYADDVAAELAAMMPPGVPPIGLFRTFARNLPMTRAMRPWGAHELGRSLLLRLAVTPETQEAARRAAARTLGLAEELQALALKTAGIHHAPGC